MASDAIADHDYGQNTPALIHAHICGRAARVAGGGDWRERGTQCGAEPSKTSLETMGFYVRCALARAVLLPLNLL